MAKSNQHESWILLTVIAVSVVLGLFYVFVFPDESISFLTQYAHIIIPVVVVIVLSIAGVKGYRRFVHTRTVKVQENRNRQIKRVEQLIWRSRYSLESQKDQILIEDTAETRAQWQDVKQNFIRTKVFPVVPETDVPMNLVSTLIENALSGGRFRSGRLPTYRVQDLQ